MIKIRAHHGLCTQHFVGFGYSDEFSVNMSNIIKLLNTNPTVKIISEVDSICKSCPENNNGCKSRDKVLRFDNEVLKLTELKSGTAIKWNDFKKLCLEKIILKDLRSCVCHDCKWSSLCSEVHLEKFSNLK